MRPVWGAKYQNPRLDSNSILLSASSGYGQPQLDARTGFTSYFVANFRIADSPDHCRSGSLESPRQSVEPGCGFVEAFEHVDIAVLADERLSGTSASVA